MSKLRRKLKFSVENIVSQIMEIAKPKMHVYYYRS